MTREIFKKWFFEAFIPQVKDYAKKNNIPGKILLLLDNAPGHYKETDCDLFDPEEMVLVRYLPKNTTSRIQPMDQNIIVNVKFHYKKSFLTYLLDENLDDIDEAMKGITLKDVFRWLINAWEKVSKNLIQSAWKPLAFFSEKSDLDNTITNNNIESLVNCVLKKYGDIEPLNSEEYRQWLNEDISPYDNITDDDIIQEVYGSDLQMDTMNNNVLGIMEDTNQAEETENLNCDRQIGVSPITGKSAVDALEHAIKYMEQENLPINNIYTLKNMKETIFYHQFSK